MFNFKLQFGWNFRPATNQYAHSVCNSTPVFCHTCFGLLKTSFVRCRVQIEILEFLQKNTYFQQYCTTVYYFLLFSYSTTLCEWINVAKHISTFKTGRFVFYAFAICMLTLWHGDIRRSLVSTKWVSIMLHLLYSNWLPCVRATCRGWFYWQPWQGQKLSCVLVESCVTPSGQASSY